MGIVRGEILMPKRSQPQTIEYAFRFAAGTSAERARMLEMIRVNLHELVKQVILTHEGREVSVDGFRLRDDPSMTYALSQPVADAKESRR